MPRKPARRQCPRCGFWFDGDTTECPQDGTSLVKRRFRMTPSRIRHVHTLALRQKGLTEEEYKLRMQAVTGKTTCKDFRRTHYMRFVADVKKLSDVGSRCRPNKLRGTT